MLGPIKSILDAKEILRLKLAAERKLAHAKRPDAAVHAARIFFNHLTLEETQKIALYHPIKDELDTKPLAEELLDRGHEIGLPVIIKKKSPLIFRKFSRGDELENGILRVAVPKETAPDLVPDIVVTPLLGFDRRGHRLGYGGGYYDRTLNNLRKDRKILAVGFAFGAQEVDAIPSSALDQRLDWIITEREAIRIS